MSKLMEMTVEQFVNEVDSDSPAPGGGSVSSLVSTIGCALARMVGHLSFGKKKFESYTDSEKLAFKEAFDKLAMLESRLNQLVDEDTKSFGIFMDALKLPKETEEEKKYRLEQMEEATKVIIKVPFEIATVSLDALSNLDTIIQYGNKNAITDVGVAALLLNAGIEGAILNVKINLPGLSNQSLVEEYQTLCSEMLVKSEKLKTEYLKTVNSSL